MLVTDADYGNIGCVKTCKISNLWVRISEKFEVFKVFQTMNSMSEPKPSLKIRTANAIFWISLGIFRDYGQKIFLFRDKTFLYFKIES